jgi:hypothetical protein
MEVHLMRVTTAIFAMLLALPGLAAAQEWEPYVNRQDGFVLNFPGQPKVAEITWQSQLGYTLPGRVYTAERPSEKFSLTVVDYTTLEQQGIARWKQCPPGNSQCRDGGATIGPGYWKQDERGAMAYAVAKYLKQPYEVTDYAWDWQDMVEGYHLQLKRDGRRVLVYIAMHERKLYILEASAPEEHPEPGIFTQSMGYLDKDGKRIRYTETVYSNSYHGLGVYPKPAYRTSAE